MGYGVYGLILQNAFLGVYSFPDYPSLELGDLWWALLVGLIAGVIGIMYKLIFGIVNLVFIRLTKRPVVCAIIGGVILGLIGSFLPLTLYSGQDQLLQIIHNPAAFGIGILLLLLLVKTVMTSTSFATGFVGGPVFPLLFIGGTLRTGDLQDPYIHPRRRCGDRGDGRRCMRGLPTSPDDNFLARSDGRTNRPFARDCHWSCRRFISI